MKMTFSSYHTADSYYYDSGLGNLFNAVSSAGVLNP
jgi:hypothetical protein